MMRNSFGVLAALGLVLITAMPERSVGQENSQRSVRERLKERMLERRMPTTDASAVPLNAPITGPGDYNFSLVHDGLTRMYRVHVPASYSASTPTPVVFSFHGGGGSMDIQANDTFYGHISKSEQAGFIAVFPNGISKYKSGMLASWNAGNCCGPARDQNIDDVGFIRAIVKRLGAELNIDRQRLFADGMSNGGLMVYRLACEMPDVFKAVASVAGTDNTKSCTPSQPISILHIHAKNDELELFDGGSGKDRPTVTSFVSVPDSIAKWVGLNGCNSAPKRVLENSGAYCDVYSPCKGGVEIKLCVTSSGGHSWPGGKKPRGNGEPSTAIIATDVIWDFFSTR